MFHHSRKYQQTLIFVQEKYIDLLKKCSPKTQFILATHSPSIVSEHTEYLEELKWEN